MSECSHDIEGAICSSEPMIDKMKKFYTAITGKSPPKIRKKLINELTTLLDVTTELDILNHPQFVKYAGEVAVKIEKSERFLPYGPKNTTDLLSNFNIDDTLKQLARKYCLGNKKHKYKFYHVPFQMIDFLDYETELAQLSPTDIFNKGYNSFGCVLNTDISSQPGKHWFCIFFDGTGKGTKKSPYYIEYFNSSGNYPMPEVHRWMRLFIAQVYRELNKIVEIYIATPYRIQNDRHSCGVYCLAYIYTRLKGRPRGWFVKVGMGDNDMLKFRQKLFRDR